MGANFKERRKHDVLDADWSVSPITKQNKDKAWSQLGTSGSGNHFVEFGLFTAHDKINNLEAGTYLALLSHSGSRGTGAAVCDYYSKLAINQFPDLPGELKRLAWLSLDSQEGQEYWSAMELMGQYAAANHACIHRHIVEHLGAQVLLDLENHHNFAWKEKHARGVHTLADMAEKINRSTVYLTGLQKRFELPPLDGAQYPETYLEFMRTVVYLRTFGVAEESLRDLWLLEKKLLTLLHAAAHS